MTSFSSLLALAAALSIGAAALPGAAAAEGSDTSTARSHKMTAARITPQQLVPLLAENVGPWQRVKVQTPAKRPGPSAGAIVEAEYRQGDARAKLSFSASDSAAAKRSAGAPDVDSATPAGSEKRYKSGSRVVHEEFKREPRRAHITVMLPNGLMLVASSQAVDMQALKQLVEGIDLAAAEAVRPQR